MKNKLFAKFILMASTIFSTVFIADAQTCPGSAGCLDTTFGSGGITTTSLGTSGLEVNAVVVQQLPPFFEPKLVVATSGDNIPAGTGRDFYVLRYNSDGSIDSSFGSGGVSRIPMTPYTDGEYPRALAIQADGKIVVAGYAAVKSGRTNVSGFALTRLHPDGSTDASFGSGGKLLFNFANNQSAHAMALAIQSNGAIIAAGRTEAGEFAVARLLPANGAFDTTFNGSGKRVIKTGNGGQGAYSVRIQPDGKIVLGGSRSGNGGYEDFALIRLNTSGSSDTSFGGTGIVSTNFFGLGDRINDIAFDAAGNIVAVGYAQESNSVWIFGAARFLPNGQLDLSFNGSGKFTYGTAGYNAYRLRGVEVDNSGRIVAAGYRDIYGSPNIRHFVVLRLNPNGTFDTDFGGTGIVFTSITGTDYGGPMVIQPDENIVVAGNSSNLVILARYLP